MTGRFQAEDLRIHAERIIKLKNKLNKIMAKNTGQRLSKIEKDTDRDNFLDPEEAVAYGLIDKVITSR